MFIIEEYHRIRFFVSSFNSCQAAIDFIMKYGKDDAPENRYVAHFFRLDFNIKKSLLFKRDVNQWTILMRNLIGIARIQKTLDLSSQNGTDVLGGNVVYYKFPNDNSYSEKYWKNTVQVAVYHSYCNHINIKTLGSMWKLILLNTDRIIRIMIDEIGIDNARRVAEKLSSLTEE